MSEEPLKLIELAGRVCWKSEDKITEESHLKFCKHILSKNHESVIEHASATVKFIVDRGVSHELVRHRLASFSQESTRYCSYKNNVTFIIPPWIHIPTGSYADCYNITIEDSASIIWFNSMSDAQYYYQKLLQKGWTPQQARSVLPNSLKTEIVVTANLREWRHIFKLRCDKSAHPQMREIMIPLKEEFQRRIPIIFDE